MPVCGCPSYGAHGGRCCCLCVGGGWLEPLPQALLVLLGSDEAALTVEPGGQVLLLGLVWGGIDAIRSRSVPASSTPQAIRKLADAWNRDMDTRPVVR